MIYLYRHADPHADIACAEGEASAVKLEARGFVRCSSALHRVLWQQRDRAALRTISPAQPTAITLAHGWKRYSA